jgi:hypothetical protein
MNNTEIRIACIGNINNSMYPIARYLADSGYQVCLFLLDEFEHFLPSADTFKLDERVEIIELGWHHLNFYGISGSDIGRIFEKYDFFIGTDYSPAYFLKARMKLDIFFPAGGDLFDYPFRKMKEYSGLPAIFQIESFRCAKYQKWALPLSNAIAMDAANQEFERYLSILNMQGIKRLPALPFLYVHQYDEAYFRKSTHYHFIIDLRKKTDFIIIQHCRQSWTVDKASLHYKANNILIEGFALFRKKNPMLSCKLLLLEYGEDVDKSKELITILNIGCDVIWLPKMLRKDLITIIKHADVGVGELGRSWLSYGAVYEILAMKIPFIGNRNDNDYKKQHPELYEMLNASNKEQMSECLNVVLNFKNEYVKVGIASYQWFLKYAINDSINKIIEQIQSKNYSNSKHKLDFYLKIRLLVIDSFVLGIVILNVVKLKLRRVFNFEKS